MSMSRSFKTVNYEQALELTGRLGNCLPPDHLARFVVDSVAQLDLSALYAQYGIRSGEPYAPEVLLGLLLYGYATGVFSSRKIERATYKTVPGEIVRAKASAQVILRKRTESDTSVTGWIAR
jgi:transposase